MEAGSALTLAEQVLAAELAYYQLEGRFPQAKQGALSPRPIGAPKQWSHPQAPAQPHDHSLHRYMAARLSPDALHYWHIHGSLLCPTP